MEFVNVFTVIDRWISVEEELPWYGEEVMVCDAIHYRDHERHQTLAFIDDNGSWFQSVSTSTDLFDDDGQPVWVLPLSFVPTHWLKLPLHPTVNVKDFTSSLLSEEKMSQKKNTPWVFMMKLFKKIK